MCRREAGTGFFTSTRTIDARAISETALNRLPDLASIDFQNYLNLINPDSDPATPLFCWDNYLYVFQKTHAERIGDYFLATHGCGDPPPDPVSWEEVGIARFTGCYREALSDYGNDGWILNIDLDYFFARQPDQFDLLQSDNYNIS